MRAARGVAVGLAEVADAALVVPLAALGAVEVVGLVVAAEKGLVAAAARVRVGERERERELREEEDLGRKRVIQRRFNVGVPLARVRETTLMLRNRSKR